MIDWDGTLVPSSWPHQTKEWMPGAKKALFDLHRAGFHLVVASARISPYDPHTSAVRPAHLVAGEVQYIRWMLDSIGATFVDIWTSHGKPSGSAYVDDRAYRYTGRPRSWAAMTEKLLVALGEEEALFPPFDQEVANGNSEAGV